MTSNSNAARPAYEDKWRFTALVLVLKILTSPLWVPFWLVHLVRVEFILFGGRHRAWQRLVKLWSQCDTVYGSMVGVHLESCIQHDAMEAFVHRYRSSESLCVATLTHPNPVVAAYAICALCRLRTITGKPLVIDEISSEVLERQDEMKYQFGCIIESLTLTKFVQSFFSNDDDD